MSRRVTEAVLLALFVLVFAGEMLVLDRIVAGLTACHVEARETCP